MNVASRQTPISSPILISLLVVAHADDVVDLEDHLHDLGSEEELLLLSDEGLEDALGLHVVGSGLVAVDSEEGVLGLELLALDVGELLDGGKAAVLGEGKGDVVKGVGEGADGVLVGAHDGVGVGGDSEGAGDLGRPSTIHDPVVLDEVADDAHGVVQTALGLLDDHLVSAPDDARDGAGVGAVLDLDHLLVGGTEGDLGDLAGLSELLGGELGEAGDDPGASGDGDEFELDAVHPADGGEVVLQKKVVGLVVKAPLTDDEVGSGVLDLLDHLRRAWRVDKNAELTTLETAADSAAAKLCTKEVYRTPPKPSQLLTLRKYSCSCL